MDLPDVVVFEGAPLITTVIGDPAIVVVVQAPQIAVVIVPGLPGPPGAAGSGGDKYYRHSQVSAMTVWDIVHNLGKRVSVTVTDNFSDEVEGAIHYVSDNEVQATFSAAFSGFAECN